MREIAHHEAGHAVAAFRDNYSVIKEIWISPHLIDGRYGNTVRINSVANKDLTDAENQKWHEDEMIICCAGPEAERRFNPKRQKMAASDRHELDRLIDSAVGLSQQEREALARHAKVNANALVYREWPAIERVAAALFDRGNLTGDDVARLIGGRDGK
jgi:hypothetical protein